MPTESSTAATAGRARVAGNVKAGEMVAGEKMFPSEGENPRWRKWIGVTQTTRTTTWAQSNAE